MTLWFIALPCVFGVIILCTILVCCLCSCSPRKSENAEEEVAEVIEVVLYPDGTTTHNQADSSPAGPHREVRNGESSQTLHRPLNARHLHYHLYPLQAGEQRPVRAAVAGSAPTRAQEPFVGTVVVPTGNSGEGRTRAAREPVSYGEAAYVSSAHGDAPPAASAKS